MLKGYPIFLNDLDQRRCVVVGGGGEATRKVKGLLAVNANVAVIAPALKPELQALVESGGVEWTPRRYQPGDLKDAFLVIADGAHPEENALIYEEAEAERALVNVMDDVEHCNFVAGSVIKRGGLTLAISTSGAAPAYSVRLRERFEAEFGEEHGDFLQLMQDLREPMARHHFCFQQRRALWYEIVDSGTLDLLREEGRTSAETHIASIVGQAVIDDLHNPPDPADAPETHTICDYHCNAPLSVTECPFDAA